MQAIQVRNIVLSLISDKLGVYRQGNIRAIWVGNPPYGQIANGLEVIIPSYPEFVVTGNRIDNERWTIRLTQFPDEQAHILSAIEILKNKLVPHPQVTYIDRPSTQGNVIDELPFLPTATIRWEISEIWNA